MAILKGLELFGVHVVISCTIAAAISHNTRSAVFFFSDRSRKKMEDIQRKRSFFFYILH